MTITKTIARTVPGTRDYLEITVDLRKTHFAVTGFLWEQHGHLPGRTRKRLNREPDAGGCLHEEILRTAPELSVLVQLHLADPSGLPMHAVANGWYFYSGKAANYERRQIAQGNDAGYSRQLEVSDHERAARALELNPDQLPTNLASEKEFAAFVDSLQSLYTRRATQGRHLLDTLIHGEGVEPIA